MSDDVMEISPIRKNKIYKTQRPAFQINIEKDIEKKNLTPSKNYTSSFIHKSFDQSIKNESQRNRKNKKIKLENIKQIEINLNSSPKKDLKKRIKSGISNYQLKDSFSGSFINNYNSNSSISRSKIENNIQSKNSTQNETIKNTKSQNPNKKNNKLDSMPEKTVKKSPNQKTQNPKSPALRNNKEKIVNFSPINNLNQKEKRKFIIKNLIQEMNSPVMSNTKSIKFEININDNKVKYSKSNKSLSNRNSKISHMKSFDKKEELKSSFHKKNNNVHKISINETIDKDKDNNKNKSSFIRSVKKINTIKEKEIKYNKGNNKNQRKNVFSPIKQKLNIRSKSKPSEKKDILLNEIKGDLKKEESENNENKGISNETIEKKNFISIENNYEEDNLNEPISLIEDDFQNEYNNLGIKNENEEIENSLLINQNLIELESNFPKKIENNILELKDTLNSIENNFIEPEEIIKNTLTEEMENHIKEKLNQIANNEIPNEKLGENSLVKEEDTQNEKPLESINTNEEEIQNKKPIESINTNEEEKEKPLEIINTNEEEEEKEKLLEIINTNEEEEEKEKLLENINTNDEEEEKEKPLENINTNEEEKEKITQPSLPKTLTTYIKKGYSPLNPKPNQDTLFVKDLSSDSLFLGVCDGHGTVGHEVSSLVQQELPIIIQNTLPSSPPTPSYDILLPLIISSFKLTNDKISLSPNLDSVFSGTTCCSLLLYPHKIVSCNLGDSRAILGIKKENQWFSENLTNDHKPDLPKEKKRIEENGGRVESFKDEKGLPFGPLRVWKEKENFPGLAMSRSFGDEVAHGIGVVCIPEVRERELKGNEKFFVVASDGVWEFIDSQECVNILGKFYEDNDIKGAAKFLCEESRKRWIQEDQVIDDISIIIGFY